jgi:uncharacterized protein (DUF58 family)
MPINHSEARQFGQLDLLARQVVEGFITGLHQSPFHGFSVEFAEHRIYNAGESTRHIDWKLYGRTDKLFVKRFEEETNLRCQIIIDNSSSMHYPELNKEDVKKGLLNKARFSVMSAAALIYLLRRQRDAVGLSIFSDALELNTQARSTPVHQKLLFAELEKIFSADSDHRNKKTSAASTLHLIAESIHKRSLVVIFSDMMETNRDQAEELFGALQHLRHNKHEVILFHVTDHQTEEEFLYDNRPYEFIDVETGERVKTHSAEIRDLYLSSYSEFKKELKLKCAQYKIDFVEADVRQGYKQVLLPYLLKRERMF